MSEYAENSDIVTGASNLSKPWVGSSFLGHVNFVQRLMIGVLEKCCEFLVAISPFDLDSFQDKAVRLPRLH